VVQNNWTVAASNLITVYQTNGES